MLGRSVGLTREEINALGAPETCAAFDARDRLVLRYTDMLTIENRVDDALFAELSDSFGIDELLELCMTIAMAGMVNRVHATFLTDVDGSTEVVNSRVAE